MADEELTVGGEEEGLLVPLDDYLSNGIHVGLKYKTSDMREFIYKIRPDKLCVFDVRKINDRINVAVEFISRYDPKDILLVSNRMYGRKCIRKFAEYTGANAITKRFVSGTLTNPNIETYCEPKLIIITDPSADQQAIREAAIAGITVVAICDTNTRIKSIDLVIPANNKGKNSLALIYWILTREVLKKKGKELDVPLDEFISRAEAQPYLLELQERQRLRRMRRKKRVRRR